MSGISADGVCLSMKYLGSAAAIAILAGCSQEALDFSQTPVSTAPEPQIQPTVESETLPKDPTLQPEVTVPSITEPLVVTPPKPFPVKGIGPIEVTPAPIPPKKIPEEINPAEAELSPAEIVARKLISDDPEENLEVLNEALQMWLATKGKLPEKIGDLVTEQLLPMLPMAPQGKIFEIDREASQVVLVADK
jgi:hypothetical protein